MKIAIYVDGGLDRTNPGPIGIGAVAVGELGDICWTVSRRAGEGTNNEAEYKALIAGAKAAMILGATEAHFFSDSQLVVQQVNSFWAINHNALFMLHGYATGTLYQLPLWSLTHVPREENSYADMLVNKAVRPDDKRAKAVVPAPSFREGRLIREGFPRMSAPRRTKGSPDPFVTYG